MGMITDKCILYGSCKFQTAGCVTLPDRGCPIYRYFESLIDKRIPVSDTLPESDVKDGYEKGLQHGKELRVKEADCAYQCGMKRAWEADNIFIDELVDGIIGNMEPIEERPLGKWQRHYTRPGVYADLFWHCSNCGYKSSNDYADRYFKYCPGCGAKMVQPQESEEE